MSHAHPSRPRSSARRQASVAVSGEARSQRRALPLRAVPLRRPDGRHERGENLLVDRRVVDAIVGAVPRRPSLPVLELGAGRGAVTAALSAAGLAVTAVEVDARLATALRRRCPEVAVVTADLLAVQSVEPHHVVSNVSFGITTALLRHLLPQDAWQTAVLLVQWEVARRRSGVGGASLLTAQWWPWVEASLVARVPAGSFRPVPSVDGGLVVLRRRSEPLLDASQRGGYQRLARRVFEAGSVAAAVEPDVGRRAVRRWLAEQGLDQRARGRDLSAAQWVALHLLHSKRTSGTSPPARPLTTGTPQTTGTPPPSRRRRRRSSQRTGPRR